MNASPNPSPHTYPEDWSRHLPALTGSVELAVAGYPTTIELDANELAGLYFPLLHELKRQQELRDTRVLVGVAGIPGSGKSTFAIALKHIADHVFGNKRISIVSMDGWHWPNAVLDANTTRDDAGNEIPLRQRKGGPESFNVDALIQSLRALRDATRDMSLPVYDRRLHEPVPDGLVVPADTRIVLVEGNYLLSRTPPWDRVSELLTPKLFLACDTEVARERTVARHIRGGMTPEAAANKYEMNDRRNAAIIGPDAANADLTISFDPEARLTRTTDKTE